MTTSLNIVTPEELNGFLIFWNRRENASYVVIDVETTKYYPNTKDQIPNWDKTVLGFSIYFPEVDDAYYLPLTHIDMNIKLRSQDIEIINALIAQSTPIFHGGKFDIQMLLKLGIDVRNNNDVIDTMLMSYVINEEPPHDLKTLAERFIHADAKADLAIISTLEKAFDWEKIPMAFMAKYCIMDTILTWKLFKYLTIPKELEEVNDKDHRFMKVLLDIELNGVEINPVEARLKAHECFRRMLKIEKELGYDPQKPLQLASRLYSAPPDGLGLDPIAYGAPSKSFPHGRPAMGVGELEQHNHPEVGLILEYRRVQKAKSTWYEGWLKVMSKENRIHPSYHQHSTVTSRLSCSLPNMQQIPRDSEENETKKAFPIKKLLVASKGKSLWEFDYSQQELRLASVYADAVNMLAAFRAGLDPHQMLADLINISRQVAKMVNFLLPYGGGPDRLFGELKKLAKQGGSSAYSFSQVQSIYNNYHDANPEFRQMQFKCAQSMIENGYIQYWSGRRRRMQYEQHAAWNSLIQGGCSEIMRESMLQIFDSNLPVKIVGQVHDSLWIEVTKGDEHYVEDVKRLMEWPSDEFGLPFPVDIKLLAA